MAVPIVAPESRIMKHLEKWTRAVPHGGDEAPDRGVACHGHNTLACLTPGCPFRQIGTFW